MSDTSTQPRPATERDLLYFRTPKLWKGTWPFQPVIRILPDGEQQEGVLFDCWTTQRRPGFSATVFLTNIFLIPPCEKDFFDLPKEVFGHRRGDGGGWLAGGLRQGPALL